MTEKEQKLFTLLEDCKKGKRVAQKELFDSYKGRMYAVCLRYAKSREEAEDMMIEGFGKIFASLNSYNYKGSFEGWMHRIMVFTAINTYYANVRHNTTVEIEEYSEENDLKIPESNIEYNVLLELIQELPEQQRLIFNMIAIDDYSAKSVAEDLDMPIGAVKREYSNAAKNMQDKLRKITT